MIRERRKRKVEKATSVISKKIKIGHRQTKTLDTGKHVDPDPYVRNGINYRDLFFLKAFAGIPDRMGILDEVLSELEIVDEKENVPDSMENENIGTDMEKKKVSGKTLRQILNEKKGILNE
jgi:hypothetical protein